MSADGWLWAELEQAAEDYAAIPEHLRPIVTVRRPTDPQGDAQ